MWETLTGLLVIKALVIKALVVKALVVKALTVKAFIIKILIAKTSMVQCIVVLSYIAGLVMLPLQQAFASSSSMEYYHHNYQGSLIEVYDYNGETETRTLSQAWLPWGERQVLDTSTGDSAGTSAGELLKNDLPVHMGYTGHKQLIATGFVLVGDARLYDPGLRRFLNPNDQTSGGIKGQNRFAYAYNNPMTYIEPDGRRPHAFTAKHLVKAMSLDAAVSGGDAARAGVTTGTDFGFAHHGLLPHKPAVFPALKAAESILKMAESTLKVAQPILKMARPMLKMTAPISKPSASLIATFSGSGASVSKGSGQVDPAAYGLGVNLTGLPFQTRKAKEMHNDDLQGTVLSPSLYPHPLQSLQRLP